jgi:hypothetical protein
MFPINIACGKVTVCGAAPVAVCYLNVLFSPPRRTDYPDAAFMRKGRTTAAFSRLRNPIFGIETLKCRICDADIILVVHTGLLSE